VGADSDYRFRGVSLSDSKPILRATLNYDAPGGWYAGASATRVELTHDDRYTQVLPYAGYVVRFDEARRLEFGASFSHFTGDSSYDYAEAYVGLLADRWSARVYYAPNYFGRQVRSAYAELNAHTLLNESARLFGHIGALSPLERIDADSGKTRIDLRIGLGLALRDLDLQLAWVAATRGGPYPAVYGGRRTAFVASASISF
jgi:uncharacterized protein (TIGR02001 family)